MASQRLIWIDCEMTGLDLDKDKLMEIACIVTEGDTLETVDRTESIIIHLDDESLENMHEWCVKQHGASGLTQECRESKVSCAEAERMVLDMVTRHTIKGECPLAGEWESTSCNGRLRQELKECQSLFVSLSTSASCILGAYSGHTFIKQMEPEKLHLVMM